MVMACMSIHRLLCDVTHQGRWDPITCEIGTSSDNVLVLNIFMFLLKKVKKEANDLTECT